MKCIRIFVPVLIIMVLLLGLVGCTTNRDVDATGQSDDTANRSDGTTNQPDNSGRQSRGTSAQAVNLMSDISPGEAYSRPVDRLFTENMADFSIELFQKGIASGDNSLVSPISIMLALAMTANGADSDTLYQMQDLLAGDIPLQELNEYLYSYVNGLVSTETSKLDIANSIWFRDDESLQVEDDFLRLNATYFMAQIFSAAFNEQTVTEINEWIDTSTDGMINNVIDDITDEVMFLINAVAFDAEWQNPYNEWTISDGTFTDESGNGHNVEFMFSGEWGFLDDGMATGFIKPYADNSYSFVALLPNEGISIDEYVHSLSGEGFLHTLESRQQISVDAYMPKFEFEYEISLVDALISLGMIDAFDARNADFSKIATSSFGNLFVSDVLHKTFISVDELGTRAGAVTVVEIAPESALLDEPKVVRLDRPFVFAIVDNSANLPIFIGTVMTV